MPITDVVNIQVNLRDAGPSAAGFSTLLIVGGNTPAEWSADIIREYTALRDMITDGFIAADAEYVAAQIAFSQSPRPASVKIGKRNALVAQVDKFTVTTVANTTLYSITINGVVFDITSDASATATEIRDALIADINAGTEPVTASTSATDALLLTADVAGESFTAVGTVNLTELAMTANAGYAEALTAIQLVDDDWYGIYIEDHDDEHILTVAAWTEATRKIFLAQSNDADVIGVATDDVLSQLQDAAYSRTALIYHDDDTEPLAAGWAASRLAVDADTQSTTWANVTVAGVPVDTISTTQQSRVEGKGGNYHVSMGGAGATKGGIMADGTFIDNVLASDWLYARLVERHQARFLELSNAGKKIPYTDSGIAMIEADARAIVEQGITAGHFVRTATSPGFTFLKRSQVPSANITARSYSYSFFADIAGAIHTLTGTVDLVLAA